MVPSVHAPCALNKLTFDSPLLIPWEDEKAATLTAWHHQQPDVTELSILIGPEGGIAPEEIAALPGQPITLGPRILRTETAAMAACAMAMLLWGDIG